MISLVFAVGEQLQFGHCGSMPWPHIKEDMNKFRDVTINKTVVMGRGTFESLPKRLHNRFHIVVSSSPDVVNENLEAPDLIFDDLELLEKMMDESPHADFCIIGGPSLLYHFIDRADEVHMTVVKCGSMPPAEHCDVLLDSQFTKRIPSEFDMIDCATLTTREGLNVVYTHFVKG